MLMQQQVRQVGESSAGESDDASFWRTLWKIRCPARVHHFLWRFAHNSHPLLSNVQRIGVELDARCVICHRQLEDGGHLFLRCKEVKKIWRTCGLEYIRQKLLQCETPKSLLATIFKLQETVKLRVICLLWTWWSERNNVNHKKQRLSPEAFQARVGYLSLEWSEFLGAKEQRVTAAAPTWVAPPAEFIKLNIDAAFQSVSGDGGWGVVGRDGTGDVTFAASGRLLHQTSALQAETEALIKSIQLAESFGMGRVIFETDCLNLQQAISSTAQDRGPLGVLFREAKFLLQLGFIEYKIMYCPRTCNLPAHVLAAIGSNAEQLLPCRLLVNMSCVTSDTYIKEQGNDAEQVSFTL